MTSFATVEEWMNEFPSFGSSIVFLATSFSTFDTIMMIIYLWFPRFAVSSWHHDLEKLAEPWRSLTHVKTMFMLASPRSSAFNHWHILLTFNLWIPPSRVAKNGTQESGNPDRIQQVVMPSLSPSSDIVGLQNILHSIYILIYSTRAPLGVEQ